MDQSGGGTYKILVEGHLDEEWAAWFDDFEIRADGPATALLGHVVDQAGLHGLLARLRDLGIPLLEVQRTDLEEGKEQ